MTPAKHIIGRRIAAPYTMMAALYLLMTALVSAAAGLTSLGILEWFSGVRWLRGHFVALGVLLQIVFGALSTLAQPNAVEPRMRWDIWLALNGGLVALLIGIPLVNATLLITGGALVFVAVCGGIT